MHSGCVSLIYMHKCITIRYCFTCNKLVFLSTPHCGKQFCLLSHLKAEQYKRRRRRNTWAKNCLGIAYHVQQESTVSKDTFKKIFTRDISVADPGFDLTGGVTLSRWRGRGGIKNH